MFGGLYPSQTYGSTSASARPYPVTGSRTILVHPPLPIQHGKDSEGVKDGDIMPSLTSSTLVFSKKVRISFVRQQFLSAHKFVFNL